jgi:hypothetical protein
MSPRVITEGETGSMMTRAPLWMTGSMELPVTTNVPMPRVRIATRPRHVARRATARTIEQICQSFFTVALLSFWL